MALASKRLPVRASLASLFGVIRCLIAEACRCWAVIMIYSQAARRAGVSFGLSGRRFLNEEALQSLSITPDNRGRIESPSRGAAAAEFY